MKNFVKILRITIVLLILKFSGLIVHSQPLPPNGNAGQIGPMGGAAPLDGGISFIILLALGYTVKKTISWHSDKESIKDK